MIETHKCNDLFFEFHRNGTAGPPCGKEERGTNFKNQKSYKTKTIEMSSSIIPVKSSPASLSWLQRINSVQQERLTPEVRDAMLARAERSSRVLSMQVESSVFQKRSNTAFRGISSGLREAQAASTPKLSSAQEHDTKSEEENWSALASRACTSTTPVSFISPSISMQRSKAKKKQGKYAAIPEDTSSDIKDKVFGKKEEIDDEEDEEEAVAAEINEIIEQHQLACVPFSDREDSSTITTTIVAADAQEQVEEFTDLLQQLRIEPKDGPELTAKFAIFETYMQAVTLLREQVLELWSRTKPELLTSNAATAVQIIDESIQKVDSENNMGCDDEQDGIWLIYYMMKQAASNHAILSKVLKDIEIKLSLLNRDDCECPMCMEPLQRPTTKILG